MSDRGPERGNVAIVAATDEQVDKWGGELLRRDIGCFALKDPEELTTLLCEQLEQKEPLVISAVIIPGIADPRSSKSEAYQCSLMRSITVSLHVGHLPKTPIVVVSSHWVGEEVKPPWGGNCIIIKPWQGWGGLATVVGHLLVSER